MKAKRLTWILLGVALVAVLALGLLLPLGQKTEYAPGVDAVLEAEGDQIRDYASFYRLDLDSSTAWQDELEAVRIITEGWYELGETKEKYNLDPNYPVDLTGLDDLNASGSAQFSEQQFRQLACDLREAAGDRQIVIVDLREESHWMINGVSVSKYGSHNWINLGMELEDIEAIEAAEAKALAGKTIGAYARDDDQMLEDHITFEVETVMSEKELVESEGFTYLRIDCTDHAWPTAAEIDKFIDFTKTVDLDKTWFHFHCQAGKGRTGVYMMLYDKMKNPDVAMEDILYRQAHLYSNYPLYLGEADSYKYPLYGKKAEMTPLLFEYVEQNHANGYKISWEKWLERR